MVKSKQKRAGSKPRLNRSDGALKRDHILQVAARLFAKKGFDRTTSKEICLAADTNMAAVNYHFGSRDALYVAVLIAAHAHLINRTALESIASSDTAPVLKLRALLCQFLVRAADTGTPWGLQVLVRELMAPSDHLPPLIRKAVQPKVRVMMTIIASVLGRPISDPVVQQAVAFVVMPCIMLAIAPRDALRKGLPALDVEPERLLDNMMRYAAAGLKALGEIPLGELDRSSDPTRP